MKLEVPPGTCVPGLHEWDRYHYDMIEGAINWSKLKPYGSGNCSQARYNETHVPAVRAPHFVVGEAVHCRVLEPERWPDAYCVKPDAWPHGGGHLKKTPTTTTEDGKLNREVKAEWDADAKGREILSADDGAMCEGIAKRLSEHKIVGPIVNRVVSVRTELTCISKYEDIFTKSLLDIELCVDATEARQLFDPKHKFEPEWFPGGVYLGDIKTSKSGVGPGVKADTWGYTCAKYKYHGQASFYSDNYQRATGITPAGFFFVPVEKVEPWEPAIYLTTPEQLDAGRRLYRECLRRRQECVASGKFPGWTDEAPLPMSCAEWGLR